MIFFFCGKKLIVEINYFTKYSNASVMIYYGDTVVLNVVTISKEKLDVDYLPLIVNYEEKMYSIGKIPGGYMKREGRPSNNSILCSRIIDRSIRFIFNENIRNKIEINNIVMSLDYNCSPIFSAIFGTSIALIVAGISNCPIANIEIVLDYKNNFIINPDFNIYLNSILKLSISSDIKYMFNMIECEANEIIEEKILEACYLSLKYIKKLIKFQIKILDFYNNNNNKINKNKLFLFKINKENEKLIFNKYYKILKSKIFLKNKFYDDYDNYEYIKVENNIKEEILKDLNFESDQKEEKKKEICFILNKLKNLIIKNIILEENIRIDGRKFDEIRKINMKTGILPRTHGSGMFFRGNTHVISICTLASLKEKQYINDLSNINDKRFLFHYNFYKFSVGDVNNKFGINRREIGHGNLCEKSFKNILPNIDIFPYTIRLVSEVLNSNGSSSQASICSGVLALIDAGIPIKTIIAGIAMGLISNNKKNIILTDILGIEDHIGDVDFKISGSEKGITSIQLDVKRNIVNFNILKKLILNSSKARLKILKKMKNFIKKIPNKSLSKYAPKIKIIYIKPQQIREIIGKNGEIINNIIKETNVEINIEKDGKITIISFDLIKIEKTIKIIKELLKEIKIGDIYSGIIINKIKNGFFL